MTQIHERVPSRQRWIKFSRSSRLVRSFRLGKYQPPSSEPSERAQSPLLRVLASVNACAHVCRPKQFASSNQISPVRLSVIVPSKLSVKRGLGGTTPACIYHRPAPYRNNPFQLQRNSNMWSGQSGALHSLLHMRQDQPHTPRVHLSAELQKAMPHTLDLHKTLMICIKH